MAAAATASAAGAVGRGIMLAAVRVAVRALRLGAAYGVKIRAPHALVMTLLFGKDRSPAAVWSRVTALAWEHGRNLALFAAAYKAVLSVLRAVAGRVASREGGGAVVALPPLASGLCGGLAGACAAGLIWRHNTHLNYQIMLYLLSRVVVATVRLLAKQGVAPFNRFTSAGTYPYLAVGVWALVMALYEADASVLHPSLASSMHEIYRAADGPGKSSDGASVWDYVPTPATLLVAGHVAYTAWGAVADAAGTSASSDAAPSTAAAGGVIARALAALGRMFALEPAPSGGASTTRPAMPAADGGSGALPAAVSSLSIGPRATAGTTPLVGVGVAGEPAATPGADGTGVRPTLAAALGSGGGGVSATGVAASAAAGRGASSVV